MNSPAPHPPAATPPKPRNPVERVVVWGGIIALLSLAVIEWRAKTGYQNTLAALELQAKDETKDVTFSEVEALLSLKPSRKEVLREGTYVVYEYSWFSLFKSGQYVLTMQVDEAAEKTADGKPVAHLISYLTSKPPAEEDRPLEVAGGAPASHGGPGMPDGMGMGGMGMGGGGGMGMGGGFGGGQRRPNPVREALDADADGALSAEELTGAAAALAKLDKDADGAVSSAEMLPPAPEGEAPPAPPAGEEQRRPPNRLVAAMDADEDGNLSNEELQSAGEKLLTLDTDGDGALAAEEIRPPRPQGGFGAGSSGPTSHGAPGETRPQRPEVESPDAGTTEPAPAESTPAETATPSAEAPTAEPSPATEEKAQ